MTPLKSMFPAATAFAKASVSQELRGIYGFLPFGTGCRPTRCFLESSSPDLSGKGMIKYTE